MGKTQANILFPSSYIFEHHIDILNDILKPRFSKYIPCLNYRKIDYDIWDQQTKHIGYSVQRILYRIMTS